MLFSFPFKHSFQQNCIFSKWTKKKEQKIAKIALLQYINPNQNTLCVGMWKEKNEPWKQ